MGIGIGIGVGPSFSPGIVSGVIPFDPLTDLTWAHFHIADDIAQADNTAVASWEDSSGNGKTAVQLTGTKQPKLLTGVLNGKSVVRADGGDALQIAGLNLSATNKMTHYLVANQTVNGALAVFSELGANWFTTPGGFIAYRESDNRLDTGVGTSASQGNAAHHTDVIQSSHAIIVLRGDLGVRRGKAKAFVNGVPGVLAYEADNFTTNAVFANSTLNLMARNALSSFQTGDIPFVATAAEYHTTDEMRKMLEWLSNYYGIAVTLPTGMMVCDGDSNTDAFDVLATKVPWPQLTVSALPDAWDYANFGVAGQTLVDQQADAAAQIDSLLDPNGENILINAGAGLNDFFNGGSATHVTPDTVWTRLTTYLAARKAAGWTIGQTTLLPNNNPGWNDPNQVLYETVDRPDIDNRIKTQLLDLGLADFIIDISQNTNIGGTTSYTNATYFHPDQAHLNQAGQQEFANEVVAAVEVFRGTVPEEPVVTDVAAIDPSSLNPVLWLKADAITPVANGTALSVWPDSSGNGRNAGQVTVGKQPTYRTAVWNDKPTVRFAGAQGMDTAAVDLTAYKQMTMYVVGSANDQTDQMFLEFSDNIGAQTTAAGAYMLASATSQLEVALKSNIGYNAWKSLDTFETGTLTPRVIHAIHDISINKHETQGGIDGHTSGRRDPTNYAGNSGFFGNHQFNIGCRNADGTTTLGLTGDIAEVIVFTGRHTAAQRWGIERYLAEKWGVTTWSKPVANLIFEGDSITEGGNTYFANTYPQRLVNRLKDKVAWMLPAVSGETLNQMTADWATQIEPDSAPENFENNIATLFGGTNDMVSVGGNQAGASVAAEYLTYVDDLKEAGFKVIAFTALPRSDTAAPADFNSTQRPAFNAGVIAGSSRYDALCNVAADPIIGEAGDELNTTYYDADKVHPNVTGLRYLSGLVETTLEESFGLETITPADISGLALHLDASAITGKVDGNAISQWDDLSSGAKHAVQATAGKQPTYKTNILNGRPVVRFDGGDALQTPSIDLSAATGITTLIVFNSTISGTDQMLFEFSDNYNSYNNAFSSIRASNNSATLSARGSPSSYATASSGVITSTHALASAVIDRNKISRETTGWKNGLFVGSSAGGVLAGTFGNYPINIAARNGTAFFLTGDIAELLIFNRVLAGHERARLEEYLAYKWGVF